MQILPKQNSWFVHVYCIIALLVNPADVTGSFYSVASAYSLRSEAALPRAPVAQYCGSYSYECAKLRCTRKSCDL